MKTTVNTGNGKIIMKSSLHPNGLNQHLSSERMITTLNHIFRPSPFIRMLHYCEGVKLLKSIVKGNSYVPYFRTNMLVLLFES